MDAKGRAVLPAPLKKQLLPVLEEGFVLKRSVFQKCLELYPMKEWNRIMEEVGKLNRFVKKNSDFIRMFTAGVKTIEMDGSGRILVPKDLIGFAGLNDHLVMNATGNLIELWDRSSYEKVVNDPEVDFGALAEDVMGNLNSQRHDLS